jgi:hypothetical protein
MVTVDQSRTSRAAAAAPSSSACTRVSVPKYTRLAVASDVSSTAATADAAAPAVATANTVQRTVRRLGTRRRTPSTPMTRSSSSGQTR